MAEFVAWGNLQLVKPLPGKGNAYLVQDTTTGIWYAHKMARQFDETVYNQIQQRPHPNLATVYQSKRSPNGQGDILEEYIQGVTLDVVLEQAGGKLGDDAVAGIALQLCSALMHLHSLPQPVIHRDIKLTNVIQQPNGVIRLVDYDIARIYHKGTATDTTALGTQGYAAPEAYGFTQTDARSDIYSLGVLMHVLLCGQVPQKSRYTGTLQGIVEKCLAFDPAKRYKDAAELYNDLTEYCGEGPLAKTKRRSKNPFDYLPGFRTRSPVKMLIAIVGYFFIFVFFSSLTADYNHTWAVWLVRICWLVWPLSLVSVYTNFLGIWRYFPFMAGKLWQRVLGILFFFAICTLITLMLMFGTYLLDKAV